MIHRHFGIDIASKTLQVCYLFNKEALQKNFKNNDKGWQLLLEWARQVCPKGQLRFCAEHTGGYEVGCVEFLQSQGIYVSVVDPMKVHHYGLSLGKKGKTDACDAQLLARYSRERLPEVWVARPEPHRLYMQLSRAREGFVGQLVELKNRAQAPGVLAQVREHLDLMMAVTTHTIEKIEAQMADLEASATELGNQVKVLVSIPGIALTAARQLLAEMGPIEAYKTPEKLALAAGLIPLPKRSGTSLNQTGLFPYGNQRLRCAAYRSALVAKRHDPAFKAYASKIQANSPKAKKTVTIACARKLMHVVWAVLTYQKAYDPNILMKDARLT